MIVAQVIMVKCIRIIQSISYCSLNSYYSAIETTKSNSDYLWHGAALEGLCVSLVLLAYLHADIGVSERRIRMIVLRVHLLDVNI